MQEDVQLIKAQEALWIGQKDRAKKLLDALLVHNPNNGGAWLMLSKLVDNPDEEADCLRYALANHPYPTAREHLREIQLQITKTIGQPRLAHARRDRIWEMLEPGPVETTLQRVVEGILLFGLFVLLELPALSYLYIFVILAGFLISASMLVWRAAILNGLPSRKKRLFLYNIFYIAALAVYVVLFRGLLKSIF